MKIKPGTCNNSGIILLTVLWVLLILSLLALGMARMSRVDLKITHYEINRIKAKAAAQAGVVYAVKKLNDDRESESYKLFDTLYACGLAMKDDDLLSDYVDRVKLEGEYTFTLSSRNQVDLEGATEEQFGLIDQERFLNLNAINSSNYQVLSALIELLGMTSDVADDVASSIADWIDENSNITNDPHGAEDEFYQLLENPYKAKNLPLDHLAEIRLIKGVSTVVYDKIKNFVTIYPRKAEKLRVNLNTAPKPVLMAIIYSFIMQGSELTMQDVMLMADDIIMFRSGTDRIPTTSDDVVISESVDINFQKPEYRSIFQTMVRTYHTAISNTFLINSKGELSEQDNFSYVIRALYDRSSNRLLMWDRD